MWGGGSVLPLKPSFQGSLFQKYPFMVKSMNGSVALGRTQKNKKTIGSPWTIFMWILLNYIGSLDKK